MSQIIETIDVDVPVNVAYNEWTQFEAFPRFLDFVQSIKQIDDTHLHWNVKVAGVEREFDAVVTEQHPDERIAWNSTSGEVDHAGVVTFHKLSDTQSRITVQLDWTAQGVVEKAGEIIGADDAAVKRSLKQFKDLVEAEGNPDGAWRGEVDN